MADERNYYVLCENNCKFPAMTKEQILTAIEQAINNGEIKDVDAGFVTKIKEQNANVGLSFWVGSQTEYNALTEKVNNCFYIITDDTASADIDEKISEIDQSIETLSADVYNLEEQHKKITHVILNQEVEFNGEAGGAEHSVKLLRPIKNYSLVRVTVDGYRDALCTVAFTGDQFAIIGSIPIAAADENNNVYATNVQNVYIRGVVSTDGNGTLTRNYSVTIRIGDGYKSTLKILKIVGVM